VHRAKVARIDVGHPKPEVGLQEKTAHTWVNLANPTSDTEKTERPKNLRNIAHMERIYPGLKLFSRRFETHKCENGMN
jgi:hypothetical protein